MTSLTTGILDGIGSNSEYVRPVAAIIVIGILPIAVGPYLATEIVIWAMFAIALNLLVGFTSEDSFGHAAYFGLGAYGVVLTGHYLVASPYLGIVVGIVLAALASVAIGFVSLRRRGIYFAMLTFAFAMMVYFIVFVSGSVTGGSNGISMVSYSAAIGPFDPLRNDTHMYTFCSIFLIVIWFVVKRIVESPLGRVFIAIRESEERAAHLGYSPNSYLLIAFVISGTISGLAGALYGMLQAFITPNVLFWEVSGDVLFVTILGGVGTLLGPAIGAGAYFILRDTIATYSSHWPFFFGILLIGVLIYLPQGIYGAYRQYRETGEVSSTLTDTLTSLRQDQ